MATANPTSRTRRSGEPVDAGVPISDLLRAGEAVSDDAKSLGIRQRWMAGIDSSRDLRLRQWVRNVLMVYGEQDIHWSQRADRWLTVPLKRLRRYKNNLLPGRLAHYAARATQSAPEWTAVPYNDTIQAEESARFCEKMLRYDYREMHIDLARYFAVIQQWLFGFGCLELYIDDEAELELIPEQVSDPNTGLPAFDMETGVPLYVEDENGKPKIKEVRHKPGIKCRPVSPFSFVVPPGLEWPLLEDAPYCIRASWLSEEYVRRRFDVPRTTTLASDSYGNYEAMAGYLWQVLNPQTLPVNRFESGRLLVLQYYEPARDVKGFYEGRVMTVCGNQLIAEEPSLWEDGRYPFFTFPGLPVTDSFYPFPTVNPATDPQARINQTLTHMMDNLGRVGSPNILADRNSGFPEKPVFQYKVYFTTPGLRRPEFMQAPSLPPGAYDMAVKAVADMDDALTSYPIGRGQNQQGLTSGLHVRLMQDADQTEMGPIVRLHAASFARMGESLLELHRVHDDEERMLAIGGGDETEFFEFKRDSIPVRQRVMVQEDSLLVHYRSAMVEQANMMASAGAFGNLLTDAGAREKYRRSVRDPHLAGPLTPEQAQQKYIDGIHYRILHKAEMPPIEEWWDINAHREAAHLRLNRESLRWSKVQKERFLQFWAALEQKASEMEAEQVLKTKKIAEEQVDLEAKLLDAEAKAKAKVELLRGTAKLAVESMRSEGDEALPQSGNGKPNGKPAREGASGNA